MTKTLYIKNPDIWRNAAERAEVLGISLGQYVERCLVAHITSAPACARCDAIKHLLEKPVEYHFSVDLPE